jgi:3-methylfumaryl-CoA hydratase
MSEDGDFQPVIRKETCSLSAARRVAAMLDLSPDAVRDGQALPIGWHFILLGADTRRSEIRPDGFPGLGVPMPELGLPRLLIGGRAVTYRHAITIGREIRRVSVVKSIVQKATSSGPMALVTVGHELFADGVEDAAIVETQTYVLLPAQTGARVVAAEPKPVVASHKRTFVPDETLLFQYSALGFNSHKIHIDKTHAREVEGFPDLVVNGGLTTLLLTEFAREELGLKLRGFRMKNLAPLYCGRPMTLAADCEENEWSLAAYDDTGTLAARMEVDLQ